VCIRKKLEPIAWGNCIECHPDGHSRLSNQYWHTNILAKPRIVSKAILVRAKHFTVLGFVFVRSVYVKFPGVPSSRYRKDCLVLEVPLVTVVRYCNYTERGDVVVAL
jgi:hypothetical protein